MQPDRAFRRRAVRVPEGHERDQQPVAPGVGGQPQRARAAGEHGGGGRAHQDLHALVAALAPRRGRRLGHPGPLQGTLSPSAAAPAVYRPALHAATLACSMAQPINQIGSPLAFPLSPGQTGTVGRCGFPDAYAAARTSWVVERQHVPQALRLLAILRPRPHDALSLKE